MAALISTEDDQRLGGLFARAQAGDAAAYDEALHETVRALKRFVPSRMEGSQGVDEVIQDTLISIHESRHTFDPTRSFASWMFAIASHRAIDYWRRHNRIQAYERNDGSESELTEPSGEGPGIDALETHESLTEALSALPEKYRTVLQLLKLEGYSIREVAARLSMTESAVKITAHRAYLKLGIKKGDPSDGHL